MIIRRLVGMIWDDHHRQLWVRALAASANLGAASDHDPVPAMLDGSAADRSRAALRQHVVRLGGVDAVVADPDTRAEFAAIAARARVDVADVDAMVHRLR